MAPLWRRLRHLSLPAYPDPRSCGVGIVGVVLVVVHLAAGRDPRWGWAAVVVLTAGTLGATMFGPWWRGAARGSMGDNDPASF